MRILLASSQYPVFKVQVQREDMLLVFHLAVNRFLGAFRIKLSDPVHRYPGDDFASE